jgi:signal transduction histidine kinase
MTRRPASLSIRARLMIVLIGMTTVVVILFAIFSLITLRNRSIELATELITGNTRGVLNLIQMTISAEEVQAAAADPSLADALETQLLILGDQFNRNEAALAISIPNDSAPNGWQAVATYPPDSAVPDLPEQAPPTQAEITRIRVDETAAIASGGIALLDENGDTGGAAFLTINADWLFEGRDQIILSTIALALILYPLVIAAAYLITGMLTRPLQLFTRAAEGVERGDPYRPDLLKPVETYSDELGKLARVFNGMAAQVQAREDALKEQVRSLEIQIDMVKQQEQVEEITENDFFHDLQRKKSELKARSGMQQVEGEE